MNGEEVGGAASGRGSRLLPARAAPTRRPALTIPIEPGASQRADRSLICRSGVSFSSYCPPRGTGPEPTQREGHFRCTELELAALRAMQVETVAVQRV